MVTAVTVASRPTGALSAAALSDDWSIEVQLTSAFTAGPQLFIFVLFFPHTHITFHVDESELSLPRGTLQAVLVMRAAFCKPIV